MQRDYHPLFVAWWLILFCCSVVIIARGLSGSELAYPTLPNKLHNAQRLIDIAGIVGLVGLWKWRKSGFSLLVLSSFSHWMVRAMSPELGVAMKLWMLPIALLPVGILWLTSQIGGARSVPAAPGRWFGPFGRPVSLSVMPPHDDTRPRVRGSTMIAISFAIWLLPCSGLVLPPVLPFGSEIFSTTISLAALASWGLFFLGFHRAILEKGYYGEIALFGLLGPPSLLLLLLLPGRGVRENDRWSSYRRLLIPTRHRTRRRRPTPAPESKPEGNKEQKPWV